MEHTEYKGDDIVFTSAASYHKLIREILALKYQITKEVYENEYLKEPDEELAELFFIDWLYREIMINLINCWFDYIWYCIKARDKGLIPMKWARYRKIWQV